MKYAEYDLQTWLKPFWSGNEMYNETVLMVGENDCAPLLYKPERLISVRNYGLDIEYERGKDYEITENGEIRRLSGSRMPFFEIDEYYKTQPDIVGISVIEKATGLKFNEPRYMKYGEEDTFTRKQIAVSYVHGGEWKGRVPASKSDRLAKFTEKLRKKQSVTAVFYGDSITTGCNASGMPQGGQTLPHTPSFDKMTCDFLHEKFGAEISVVNTAVGGMNTRWGLDNVGERVVKYAPDLAVIAFGMNDPALTTEQYKEQILGMIGAIRAAKPDCAIILVSTTVPNNESDWYSGNQKEYFKALYEIEENPQYPFVAVADMTAMHLDLLERKRFRDMTGNNVNHPNDFLVRAYAQVLLATIL